MDKKKSFEETVKEFGGIAKVLKQLEYELGGKLKVMKAKENKTYRNH